MCAFSVVQHYLARLACLSAFTLAFLACLSSSLSFLSAPVDILLSKALAGIALSPTGTSASMHKYHSALKSLASPRACRCCACCTSKLVPRALRHFPAMQQCRHCR